MLLYILLGIGDWGLGIGDWGLGPIPNPQSNMCTLFISKNLYMTSFENKRLLQHDTTFNIFSRLFV